jgi:hypothetical protein
MKTLKSLFNDNTFHSKKKYYKKKENTEADIFDFLDLVNNWEDIVGPRLVESTIPLKLMNKSLNILTSHPVFAQQLSYMENVLIKKIEERFPQLENQIKKIYFKADNQHFQKKIQTKKVKEVKKEEFTNKWHKQSPQYKKLVSQAEAQFDQIKDQELKESLTSLFIQLSGPK